MLRQTFNRRLIASCLFVHAIDIDFKFEMSNQISKPRTRMSRQHDLKLDEIVKISFDFPHSRLLWIKVFEQLWHRLSVCLFYFVRTTLSARADLHTVFKLWEANICAPDLFFAHSSLISALSIIKIIAFRWRIIALVPRHTAVE